MYWHNVGGVSQSRAMFLHDPHSRITVPGVHLAHRLRHVIKKARSRLIFNAETKLNSPRPSSRGAAQIYASASAPGSEHSPLDFDLFVAEQLLNQSFESNSWADGRNHDFGNMFGGMSGDWAFPAFDAAYPPPREEPRFDYQPGTSSAIPTWLFLIWM